MRRALLPLARTALAALILYLLFRGIGPARLSSRLRDADWGLVALAAVLNLVFNGLGRVIKFSLLLGALCLRVRKPGFRELTELLFSTRTLNMVLPARFGEAYRLSRLRRDHGYPMTSVATTLLLESLIEVIAICGVAPIALFSLPSGGRTMALACGFAVGGVAVVIGLRRFIPPIPPGRRPASAFANSAARARARILEALHRLSAPRTWIAVLAWTLFADLVDLLTIGLCLNAVNVRLGPSSWILVLLGVNLAILLPIVPGNLGTFEAGAVLALAMLGVREGPALTFAVLYHMVQTLPIAAVGVACLRIGARSDGKTLQVEAP